MKRKRESTDDSLNKIKRQSFRPRIEKEPSIQNNQDSDLSIQDKEDRKDIDKKSVKQNINTKALSYEFSLELIRKSQAGLLPWKKSREINQTDLPSTDDQAEAYLNKNITWFAQQLTRHYESYRSAFFQIHGKDTPHLHQNSCKRLLVLRDNLSRFLRFDHEYG